MLSVRQSGLGQTLSDAVNIGSEACQFSAQPIVIIFKLGHLIRHFRKLLILQRLKILPRRNLGGVTRAVSLNGGCSTTGRVPSLMFCIVWLLRT